MEKLWAAVSHQGTVLAELLCECSAPPVPLVPKRVGGLRQSLLQLVTKKSENYTVDQLERLFSLLSQCIYQHRRDYDKTHLTEDMERTVDTFETFL
ncbi:ATPase family AAA domain-containing protein 2B [Acipenser ruthenus]|uniref:ATPase family AAA domain-containing protein 2B n=1 Tax=Acipenser ruthenus TaxID=7906 RepID=A0A662YYZ5_ACIRT|nr:ATPase family AAA domain-containing protein 2B [Acipenser ruthenus]